MVLAPMPGRLVAKIPGFCISRHRLKHELAPLVLVPAVAKYGLAAPMAATRATEEYLQAEDTIASWIEGCCETGDPGRFKTANAALFASWRGWCERGGEHRSRRRPSPRH